MIKAFSGICLGVVVLAGCAAGEAAAPPVTPTSSNSGVAGGARRLGEALIKAPAGMQVAYGPETGAFGSLRATTMGKEAMRQATFNKPQCATTGQLDADQVKDAPAAVVSFSSAKGSLTHALVSLSSSDVDFPRPLDPGCASYKATVQGAVVTYKTKELKLPRMGDASRAFQTTANGTQIGSVAIRYRNVVMSVVVIGRVVNLERQSRQAYARLLQVVK